MKSVTGSEDSSAGDHARESGRDCGRDWARKLLLSLEGRRTVQGQAAAPEVLPACASGALMAIRDLLDRDPLPGLQGADLLTERATLLGLPAPGQVSANGSCHLLPARDGWLALNLARDEDRSLLPAWLEHQGKLPDLGAVAQLVQQQSADLLVGRGRLMGLPLAACGPPTRADNWFARIYASQPPALNQRQSQPLVVDLSSLWAGPLCSHLLERSGARVIKVESAHRPDGSRTAVPAFFDRLNQNKQTLTVDFHTPEGMRTLHRLLTEADVVIEASRPRALAQLGIDAEALLRDRPGKIWLSITAYGRHPPNGDWVGFGDDVAVAAGAVRATSSGPAFYGDAVADPLTGLHGALAVLYHWQNRLGGLLDVSLHAVTAWCLTYGQPSPGLAKDSTALPGDLARQQTCC